MSESPKHWEAGLAKLHENYPLAGKDKAEIAKSVITKYLDGQELEEQAKELGVTNKRLYQILTETAHEEWKSAQSARALEDYDKAQKGMETASDALEVARARELLKSAQWRLERVLKRIYGTEPGQNVPPVQITIGLRRNAAVQTVDIEQVQVIEDC